MKLLYLDYFRVVNGERKEDKDAFYGRLQMEIDNQNRNNIIMRYDRPRQNNIGLEKYMRKEDVMSDD